MGGRELKWVRVLYKGFQGVILGDKELQGVTGGNKGLQGVTGGDRG